jgi:hypothetical protein
MNWQVNTSISHNKYIFRLDNNSFGQDRMFFDSIRQNNTKATKQFEKTGQYSDRSI